MGNPDMLRAGLLSLLLVLLLPVSASRTFANEPTPNISPEAQARKLLLDADRYRADQDLPRAIESYNKSIALDDSLDKAYFGRGMALGRAGYVEEAIRDLSVFIKRNPDSSLGYTKRGVRYLWKGDILNAQRDLLEAVRLDDSNAEAHDDLGVTYAQQGQMGKAFNRFNKVIAIDPTYQKGYHNLAMVLFISEQYYDALKAVRVATSLDPDSRNSQMLKVNILQSLGRDSEARVILENIKALPEGDWHQEMPIK